MTLTARYHAEVARLGYASDGAQLAAVARLDALRVRLARAARYESGLWRRLAAAVGGTRPPRALRGIYLYGPVGRGKTLLLDLFVAALEVPSQRVHFHHFMQQLHLRLDALRALALTDPLARVAAELASSSRVLCFDELYVGDIADAMLLGRVFAALIEHGVTLVVTSNFEPDELYKDGLQRARFLPAIELLKRATAVTRVDGGIDYRLRQLERAPLYVQLAAAGADAELEQRFAAIAAGAGIEGGTVELDGRPIAVRRRAADTVWFEFAALCAGPRGVTDYIAIASEYHTVIVSGVPVFDVGGDDEARRFIALVDECYDRGVKLVLSAAAPPDELYRGERLGREFERAASRLAEMQTRAYLARAHHP